MINPQFSDTSFVKVELLKGPIYRSDSELWQILERNREEVRDFFAALGQELVADLSEGYAFIRQTRAEGDERIPRLVRNRRFSYEATLIAVLLREEMARIDLAADVPEKLVRSKDQIIQMVAVFLPERNNRVKDLQDLQNAINSLRQAGFLRPVSSTREDLFEVTRLLKARITPEELVEIKTRLQQHAPDSNPN